MHNSVVLSNNFIGKRIYTILQRQISELFILFKLCIPKKYASINIVIQ